MILWSTPPELDTVLRSIRVLPGLYGLPVVQKQLIEPVVGMGADTRDQAAKRLAVVYCECETKPFRVSTKPLHDK